MKYTLDNEEYFVSEEGLWQTLKIMFKVPSANFKYLFIDLPTKYKYKLIGQVFCRPAPGYKMPRIPTVFNVDNSKVIPYWPTVKSHGRDDGKSIARGMDFDEVLKQWTKFADLMEGISKLSEDKDAGLEIDTLFKKIFKPTDFDSAKGTKSGIRFKIVPNTWPSDKWFKDVNYSMVDKLEKQAVRITKAAQQILENDYRFRTDSEALECSGKSGMLRRLILIYRKTTTKCYNFSASLYKGSTFKG